MRFVVDECTGPEVADWLKSQGHFVLSIYNDYRGMKDEDVIKLATNNGCILISNDKDFGEKIFRQKIAHEGVIFLRLKDERKENKIIVINELIDKYGDSIKDYFIVATENKVRLVVR
jgi:predicted nuclease of predicted toxin-antitoxin system